MTRPPVLLTGAFLVGALLLRPQGASAPAEVSAAVEVPIGGIILWWGRAEDIPEGFEACDGTTVSTRGAVLRGAKPDLQSRFPRGAPNYRSFVPQAYAGGGSDTLVLDGSSVRVGLDPHVFTLTTEQLPRHRHGFGPLTHDGLFEHSHTLAGHSHGMDHLHAVSDHTHGGIPTVSVSPVDGSAGSGASNVTTGTTNSGSVTALPGFRTLSPIDAKGKPRLQTDSQDLTTSTTQATLAAHPASNTSEVGGSKPIQLPHKLTVTSTQVDNRPAFLDVVFLIRVK